MESMIFEDCDDISSEKSSGCRSEKSNEESDTSSSDWSDEEEVENRSVEIRQKTNVRESEKLKEKISTNDYCCTDVVQVTAADFDGREFKSEDEAYELYVKYARVVGFGVRKSDVARDRNGRRCRRKFVCSRAGLRDEKHYSRDDRKREHKAETRTNCSARLMIYRSKRMGVWRVRRLIVEHNHEMTMQYFAHLIPNHRRINTGEKVQIETMYRYGMQTSQIMGFMAGQSGGYRRLGFSKKDLYNYIDRDRRGKIADGDAEAAISYLEGRADCDGLTLARYTTIDDDRLGNLFWADGISRADYQYFGDVIAFDATYKKNKYKKPLVIFSGVNHHRQTCIFGFALLLDERIESYQWLLEQFLDVMANRAPAVVVTDGDDAMREAIRRVFPEATHRLCAWNLQKNATSNIKDKDFFAAFKECIYANYTCEQFEERWKDIVEKFDLAENRWVISAYEKKEMWATAYLRGKFSAGIRTTSRCEGINCFIKRFIKSRYSILDLVQSLERVLKEYRNNELEAQFRSIYTWPVLTTGLRSIEEGAARVYTRAIFKEVRKEIEHVCSLVLANRTRMSTSVAYRLCKFGKPDRIFEVLYDSTGDKDGAKVECKCCYWNMNGIPCRHMFFVMKEEHICEMPKSMIKRRWCKDAKVFEDNGDDDDTGRTQILRRAALAAASGLMTFLGSESRMAFRTTMDGIESITSKLESGMYFGKGVAAASESNKIGDPNMSKTKGAPRKGKVGLKKRCCSNCGEGGHTKRTCPNSKEADESNTDDEYDAQDRGVETSEAAMNVRSTQQSTAGMHNDGVGCVNQGVDISSVERKFHHVGSGNIFIGGHHINQIFPYSGHYQTEVSPFNGHQSAGGNGSVSCDRGHQWLLQNFIDSQHGAERATS